MRASAEGVSYTPGSLRHRSSFHHRIDVESPQPRSQMLASTRKENPLGGCRLLAYLPFRTKLSGRFLDFNHRFSESYFPALASTVCDSRDEAIGFVQRPGILRPQEGHLPSRREFCRTSCQERRIRIWPQPGHNVWAA